jgi:lysozyme
MIKWLLEKLGNFRMKKSTSQTYSKDAVALIKAFEGFEPKPYKCPAGKLTIGYGHVIKKGVQLKSVTERQAENLMRGDLLPVEEYIRQKVLVRITQGQFDALCSLVYNWGCANFGKSKGLRFLNEGRYTAASLEFFSPSRGVVNVKGKPFKGLIRRREAENMLWDSIG